MTNLNTLFPRSAFLGFDRLFDELEYATRHSSDSYPPHDVIKVDDENYRVEMAIAGFSKDEIEVSVKQRSLRIEGDKEKANQDNTYIHRGISKKNFRKVFRLSEYVEVNGARFENGLLVVDLKVVVPETERPRIIEIQ